MDDNRFDKYIKEKMEGLPEQPFDEGALANLHSKLDGAVIVAPWYVRYKGTLVTTAILTVFTLLNFLMLTHFIKNEDRQLMTELDNLKHKVSEMPASDKDTVYIYRDRVVKGTDSDRTNNNINALSLAPKYYYALPSRKEQPGLLYLGSGESLSAEAMNILEKNYTLIFDQEDVYLLTTQKPRLLQPKPYQFGSRDSRPYWDKGAISGSGLATAGREGSQGKKVSAKTLRELDKHYTRGIGIKAGLEIEFNKIDYDIGKSKQTPAYGIVGEFILSPKWSLETGTKFSLRSYSVDGTEIENEINSYPGIDQSLGTLTEAESDSWVLEIPVNLRYYYPISYNKEIFISLGYAPSLYLKQSFEYNYEVILNNNQKASIENTASVKGLKLYTGVVNTGLGISWLLPNNKTLQLGFFYRDGLDKVGVEGREIRTFGFKTSYLFRIR